MHQWTYIILMIIYTGFVAWAAIKLYKYYLRLSEKKPLFKWPQWLWERPDVSTYAYQHGPMITVTPSAKQRMKMGIHKNPQVYHSMPECQDNDYQGNNYVLRACRYCCTKYSKEVAKSGGIDVYTNNVLTSQGSKQTPQFLDEHDPRSDEKTPGNLPAGLPLEDLSGLR